MAIFKVILSYTFILFCIFLTTYCVYKAVQFLKFGAKNKKKVSSASTIGMSWKEKREAKRRRKEAEREELQKIRNHIKGGDLEDEKSESENN